MKRNILLVLAIFLATFARADEISVPLPKPIYQNIPVASAAGSQGLPDLIDVSLSSWAPNAMHPYSSLQNVSAFSCMYPGMSTSFLKAIRSTRAGDFYWRAGAEFRGESRAAPGFPDEDLYLVTFRLGTEWAPPRYHSRYFIPALGFSLLPTLASASPTGSSYDNGISSLALPVEFSLGTQILISPSRPSLPRLNIAAQMVVGRVLGSELFSSGVIGGVRIPL